MAGGGFGVLVGIGRRLFGARAGGGFSEQQAWPWVAPAPCNAELDLSFPPTDLERVIYVVGNVGRCKIINYNYYYHC